jgi:hypothetical protein
VTRETSLALFIGLDERMVELRRVLSGPRKESGAKIEADSGIVVQNMRNALVLIENTGGQIGSVALSRDALVPVMVRIGRILQFNLFKPRILAWRLIEVTVNTEIFHSLRNAREERKLAREVDA